MHVPVYTFLFAMLRLVLAYSSAFLDPVDALALALANRPQ